MPLNDDEMTKDIIAGDYVRVELDVEVFKMMQTEEHGGWHDAMALVSITNCYHYYNLSVLLA